MSDKSHTPLFRNPNTCELKPYIDPDLPYAPWGDIMGPLHLNLRLLPCILFAPLTPRTPPQGAGSTSIITCEYPNGCITTRRVSIFRHRRCYIQLGPLMPGSAVVFHDYLWALAFSEWTRYSAATWIEQILSRKRFYQLDDFVIRAMHRLGYDAPITFNPRGVEWDEPVSVTPGLYQRLQAIHAEVDWEEIATRHLPVIAAESKKHLWLPFYIHAMTIDWDNPILGFSFRRMMSRDLINSTSGRDALGRPLERLRSIQQPRAGYLG